MKYQYKTVTIRSLKGLKRAEWYKSHGWKIISVGFETIQFEKPINKKRNLENER